MTTAIKRSKWQAIKQYIKEYCCISGVHGLYHLVNSRHLLEKLLWVCLLWMSTYFGWSLSMITLNRYNTNPTVISIERDSFSWTTFLPAVTICPIKYLDETALEQYVETRNFRNRTAVKEFLISLFYANYTNLDTVVDNEEIVPDEYMAVVLKLQKRLEPSITLSGQLLDSEEWFYRCITEMGVCHCFNSQLAAYSSPEYWLENKWEILPHLKKIEVHPLDGEVFVSIVNLTTIPADLNVYVHGPYEVADLRTRPLFLPKNYYFQIYLKALSIITSESAGLLKIDQRKCRFYSESNLLHSPVYTYVLCSIECRIMLANKLCGCVPHFYRKLPNEKTCGVKDLHCLSQYKEELVSLESLGNECSCLANCEEVNYVVEETDMREWFLGTNFLYAIKNFPEMRLKRDVIFGFSDLLVYIGGLIGLFFGSSLLTIIECVYYFTLRLFWFIIRRSDTSTIAH